MQTATRSFEGGQDFAGFSYTVYKYNCHSCGKEIDKVYYVKSIRGYAYCRECKKINNNKRNITLDKINALKTITVGNKSYVALDDVKGLLKNGA